MKKLLTILMSTLMVLTSTGTVFAEEGPTVDPTELYRLKDTNLTYEVSEAYDWSVPSKLEFSKDNLTNVSATGGDVEGKISVDNVVIKNDKQLMINVAIDQEFTISDGKGTSLNYVAYADGSELGAGETVISVQAGEAKSKEAALTGTLTTDANEVAGDYSGSLEFVAELAPIPEAKPAEGGTATNPKISALSSELISSLKDELKNDLPEGLTEEDIDDAILFDLTADTAGTVNIDITQLNYEEGKAVLVYHKGADGWELVGQGIVGEDDLIECTFTSFSPVMVLEKEVPQGLVAGLYDADDNLLVSWDDSGIDVEKDYAINTTESTAPVNILKKYPTCTSVIIPSSVTKIGSLAFRNCTSLTSVTIPESVTTIGSYAFAITTNLVELTIPDTVTEIGEYAFSSISHIYYYGSATGSPWGATLMNDWYDNDFAYGDADKTILKKFIGTATSVEIPNSVITIDSSAFYNCTSLTSVTIPNTVTSIGDNAFSSCTKLASITFEEGSQLETIGNYAFYQCKNTNLNIEIPDTVTSIGKDAFYAVQGVKYSGTATGSPWGASCLYGYVEGDLAYTNSLKEIVVKCFKNGGNVIIPNTVIEIGEKAFYNKTVSVTYEEGSQLKTIGNYAFYNAYDNPYATTIPNTVETIGDYAFYGNGSKTGITLTIPASVKTIGKHAFEDWGTNKSTNVIELVIPNDSKLESIGESAFEGAFHATKIELPSTIKRVDKRAFYINSMYKNAGIDEIVVPENITTPFNDAIAYNTTKITYLGVKPFFKLIQDGTVCILYFEEGMTWSQWVNSEYNTVHATVNYTTLKFTDVNMQMMGSGIMNRLIENGEEYKVRLATTF